VAVQNESRDVLRSRAAALRATDAAAPDASPVGRRNGQALPPPFPEAPESVQQVSEVLADVLESLNEAQVAALWRVLNGEVTPFAAEVDAQIDQVRRKVTGAGRTDARLAIRQALQVSAAAAVGLTWREYRDTYGNGLTEACLLAADDALATVDAALLEAQAGKRGLAAEAARKELARRASITDQEGAA
jgi:hypothetical protein